MSDPSTRRKNAVGAFLLNLAKSKEGWTLDQCVGFLVRMYGFGIRDKTARDILEQLGRHGIIYKTGSRFYLKKTGKDPAKQYKE